MPTFDRDTIGSEVVSAYPDRVAGKTFLITGPSSSGVGAQTALYLAAANPALLMLAGRSLPKIQPVIDQIAAAHPSVRVAYVALDLASNASVRAAAAAVRALTPRVHVLINNAGIMALPSYTASADGVELHFAANHLGHFLLTNLLMPALLAAGPDARIVNLSSLGYMSGGVRFEDPNFADGKEYNPWLAYAQSKTANFLFTHALADRLKDKGVHAYAVNPGLIFESKLMANVSKEMFAEGHRIATAALNGRPMPSIAPKSLAAGASTSLYGALDPALVDHSGAFLNHCAVDEDPLMDHAVGVEKQDKLWALSEKLVGETFDY